MSYGPEAVGRLASGKTVFVSGAVSGDVVEAAVYPIPDPAVGDQVMSALVLLDHAEFSVDDFSAFLASQEDLGPKQWPRFVRVATTLPRTETFKVIKRQLSAEGTDCADPVFAICR